MNIHQINIQTLYGPVIIFAPWQGSKERTLDFVIKSSDDVFQQWIKKKPVGSLRHLNPTVDDFALKAPVIYNYFKNYGNMETNQRI